MGDDLYFDGDPAVDSSRRHMERVLKGDPGPPKWTWLLAAVAGGGLFALWRAAGQAGQAPPTPAPGASGSTEEPRGPT